MPVIVSNFNYFYHRGTDNDDQKDLKYSPQNELAQPVSTGSINKKTSDLFNDDSGECGNTSYHNMMIINDADISDTNIIYNSPIIPTILANNLLDSWSSSSNCAASSTTTTNTLGHLNSNSDNNKSVPTTIHNNNKYYLITNNTNNRATSSTKIVYDNDINIHTNV